MGISRHQPRRFVGRRPRRRGEGGGWRYSAWGWAHSQDHITLRPGDVTLVGGRPCLLLVAPCIFFFGSFGFVVVARLVLDFSFAAFWFKLVLRMDVMSVRHYYIQRWVGHHARTLFTAVVIFRMAGGK